MGTLTRSKIIPAASDESATVEKWAIPELRSVKAAVVNLDKRRTQSTTSGPGNTQRKTTRAMEDINAAEESSASAAFESGYQDGMRAAMQQYTAQQQQLDNLLRALQSPLNGLGDEVAKELVSLALDIARSVLSREIDLNPGQLADFIVNAMSQLPGDAHPAVITIHPEDLKLIKEHALGALNQYNIEWAENESADRGSFQVTHNTSVIHGGIDAILQSVAKQLNAA